MLSFAQSGFATIPQLAIVLGIMVLVHEFGHFAVAKLCGVRVESFAIGFGKRLIGFVHDGTDYRLNLVPLGGYVKMAGEYGGQETTTGPVGALVQATPSADPGEYQNHPRWQRVLIALAGPFANFLLAFLLLTVLYMTDNEVPAYVVSPAVADYVSPASPIARTGMQAGDRIVSFDGQENPTWLDIEQRASSADQNLIAPFAYEHAGHRVNTKLSVDSKGDPRDFDFASLGIIPVEQLAPIQVSKLSDATLPAARAGLQEGDKIVTVDGLHLHSVPALIAYMQDQAGKPAVLNIERTGADKQPVTTTLTITPVLMDTREGKGYRLGFTPVLAPAIVKPMPLDEAMSESLHQNVKDSHLVFDILGRLFTRQVSVKAMSSPIGIGVAVHEALSVPGWSAITGLMAMISLQLGIFNLLPIPILDGGMILFLAIESAMRRDLNAQVKERVYQVAFVCIVLFAAMVIFNDLSRYVVPHFIKP